VLTLQVALAVILTVTAGLYAHSLYNISRIETGYRSDSTLLARLAYRSVNSMEARQAFLANLLGEIRAHPEVAQVALSAGLPFGFADAKVALPENPDRTIGAGTTQVGGGFFDVSGIRILAGREFDGSQSDLDHAAIVNKQLADALWPNQNAVRRVLHRNGTARVVVGIVEFDRCQGLVAPRAACLWEPFATMSWQAYLRLRTHGNPLDFLPELRRMVRGINPDVSISDVNSFDSYVADLTANQRTSAIMSAALAAVGIALVAIGCFSLFASIVKDSAREIAIRIAIGATPARVISTTLAAGLSVVFAGSVAGLAVSVFVARRIQDQLFNVSLTDTPAFILTVIGMISIGLIATYWPARSRQN